MDDYLREPRISPATTDHLPAIVELADRWQLRPGAGVVTDQGFLMAGWGRRDYELFLSEAELFFVAIHEDELAGFFIGYSCERRHFEPWLHAELARHLDAYMLFEQMCIAPEWAHRGVGSRMMSSMLALDRSAPVISESARVPLNTASTNLHRKFDFTPLVELTRPSGLQTTVWIHE
ncbi:GNAT family N-acetyltransferase [Streptomyces sp. PTM05]|uniref:GNAT family N-acetyltransferase n=1 Tax=Streptantibioticus parmotrematis TaxID=2873249 RepID=A0ABS7QUZ7_9ACTN|nr:GNAT family N-acetyltransferase [Streptantibioticus parmotrematis]MBY8887022.1 GNAT family N-acetyltransferase [Streptantibioticus parmotrematis]